MKAIRWSDNDKYFGRFTYCNTDYKRLALYLGSGDGDDYAGCKINIQIGKRTLIAALPAIIKPWKVWVDTSGYAWANNSGGYWDKHERRYGFSYSEGFLQVYLGRQTHNSDTTQSWNKFIPWTQWRHVRTSHYGVDGSLYFTEPKKLKSFSGEWKESWEKSKLCPSVSFNFLDFDGEEIVAKTTIEEREWKFGEGWFKWLSLFRKNLVRRSLNIEFSKEVGKRKGSWKGGIIGTGIEMSKGESHESAFKRYCEKESLTFNS